MKRLLLAILFVATTASAADRVYELRVYHAVPGKLPVMEARFRDTTSKILARHHLDVVGYWTGDGDTFVFLLSHASRDEAKKNWAAVLDDPDFQQVIKAEQAEKTLEKAEIVFMRPTDFSSLRYNPGERSSYSPGCRFSAAAAESAPRAARPK